MLNSQPNAYSCEFILRVKQSFLIVVVVAIIPPLPQDGGTARTAIQGHAVHLIEIRLGKKMAANSEPVMNDW